MYFRLYSLYITHYYHPHFSTVFTFSVFKFNLHIQNSHSTVLKFTVIKFVIMQIQSHKLSMHIFSRMKITSRVNVQSRDPAITGLRMTLILKSLDWNPHVQRYVHGIIMPSEKIRRPRSSPPNPRSTHRCVSVFQETKSALMTRFYKEDIHSGSCWDMPET